MRMLLVEDEKKVCELVARALRAERYAVDVAGDGQCGSELAEACDYDHPVTRSSMLRVADLEVDRFTQQVIREADLNYQIGAPALADAQLPEPQR